MQDSAAGPSAKLEAHLPEVDVILTTSWCVCLSSVLTGGWCIQVLVGSVANCVPSSLMDALPLASLPPAKEANLVRQVQCVKPFSMEDGGAGSVPSEPKAADEIHQVQQF